MDSSRLLSVAISLLLFQLCFHRATAWPVWPLPFRPPPNEPTNGFLPVPLNSSSFVVQSPCDLPVTARYTIANGVQTFWVLASDNPHSNTSRTTNTSISGNATKPANPPNTEIRLTGYDYNSGAWQFQGNAYVPAGTTGVTIMQIYCGKTNSTTLMLKIHSGALMYYDSQLLLDNMYDKWFQVNVIHDVDGRQVSVYIDGVLKYTASDVGGGSSKPGHYFKYGVYQQPGSSFFTESRWREIKLFKRM